NTDLHASRTPWWWRLVTGIQWLLLALAVTGLGWLLLRFAQLPVPTGPEVLGTTLAVVMLVAGLVLGPVLDLGCRMATRTQGARKARRAEEQLQQAIEQVAQQRVLRPIAAELDAYQSCRYGLLAATATG